ncbi:Hsp70 family protein [Actinophytocola sp. NPDC049390]|uniref:Hsp70 family protein n=1 Tax=Actinophytocola sp. NPDC049390 TaxID=3363894 RepID=UPI00379BBA0D
MRYAVGIDLGTTFTAAAVSHVDGTRMVALTHDIVVPAVACHTAEGKLLTGSAAIQAAADNPARLAHGFKRRLGDPTPLMIGGAAYSPAALMAAQLRDVLDQVSRAMGGPPDSIVLTCPAIWGPYRREQFAEVPRLAGITDYQLITEPEAAARHYSRERTLGDGETVAVYDLGGGTLDTTVLRMRAGTMEILGTPEGVEHLGGMDFDDALLAHVDERLDGAIGRLDPADALADLRALCVRAKIELSTEPDVTLTVPLPSGPREVTITRRDFNAAITPSVELTIGALRRTIASAGLRDEDLSAVLLAGGSSRIPLVTQLVFEEFDKPVRVSQHPKFTVALGAATVAGAAVHQPAPAAPPAVPAPVGDPVVPPPTGRRRWLVPAAAAVIVVVATLITALIMVGGSDDAINDGNDVDAAAGTRSERPTATAPATTDAAPTTTTRTAAGAPPATVAAPGTGSAEASVNAPAPPPPPLTVFGDDFVGPYRAFIASAEKWDGTELTGGSAAHAAIAARVSDGLRVTWRGGEPAQVYLQTVNATKDLSSYVDGKGALRFSVSVHSSGAGTTSLATHCRYPCGAELDVTELFKGLPVGSRTEVTIPLTCFTAAGLDKTMVNTPFLVYAQGPLDVTFRDIRWVPGAADDPDATPCSALS